MTVKSDQRKIIYEGNGTTTQFAVPFYFINQSDIEVSVYDGTTTTPLVLNTDYTLTGAGVETGGTVTTAEPVATGSEIAILRNVPYKQEMDIPENDIFPSQNMERALDRLTMQTQQLAEQVARSVTVDVFSDTNPSQLINEIEVLYDHKDEVITAAENIADISAVAANETNINAAVANESNINAAVANETNINAAVANETNVNAAVANESNINTVAGISADVSAVAAIDDEITAVAGDLTNIDAAVANETNINAVAGNETNINAVAGNETNINAAVANATNINAAVANETNINAAVANATNINAAVANETNINAAVANATNINTAATNISDINTAAANIAAIIDAPNQASAAAASAALAEDWASKTDGPVEGSDYSAKWYAINTDASNKASKDLSDLTAAGQGIIDTRAENVFDAKILTVSALPASPDADTYYYVTG